MISLNSRRVDIFVDVEHPVAGTATYPGAPFKMSATPWKVRRPAPMLGEHNMEILGGKLGYSQENILRLRSAGVI